jgi:hypothetical protein
MSVTNRAFTYDDEAHLSWVFRYSDSKRTTIRLYENCLYRKELR